MARISKHTPLYKFGAMQKAGGSSGSSTVLGASFDGTNDDLLRGSDLTGSADGKLGIIATRIRFNGGDGVVQLIIDNEGSYFSIRKLANNTVRVWCKNSVGATILDLRTSGAVTADGDYHNLIFAFNTADAGACLAYIDDVDDTNLIARTDDSIDYTRTDWAVGSTVAEASRVNADIAFLYVNIAETLGISVEANRRKFFSSQGLPVLNPNGDGSEATGSAPIMYFAGDYQSWNINKGSGGGLAVTGSLSRPAS